MTNVLAIPPGTKLVEDYRIESVLGAGGFGITYLAQEAALARQVTIKEYFPTDFATRDSLAAVPRGEELQEDFQWGLERFIEEAQTLAKFDHPNIVKVYRYFQLNGTAYMVLSFEEGESLKGWLKGLGRAPRQRELDSILGSLLDALETIHAADYLHRDIAPDNIIIRKDGTPVLIDFGSARGEIATRSRTVSALVKPGYSPYEQYAESGARQGPWTDIYALGATLYHAICGKRPPDAPSRVVKDDLAPPHEVALAAYRQRFLTAIDRALTLDPGSRPQSIAAWRGDLLAPEPAKPSWLQRATGRGTAEPPSPQGPAPALQAGIAPPVPDAPGSPGQMLDFIEGLKQKSAQAGPDLLAAASSGAAAAAAAPAGAAAKPDPAPQPSTNPSRPSTPPSAPRSGPRSREKLPVPMPARDKPPRPRAMKVGSRRQWRSFAFKFLIGAGIAGAAIAYQDRLPAFMRAAENTTTGGGVAVGKSAGGIASRSTGGVGSESPRGNGIPIPRILPTEPSRLTMLAGHRGGATAVGFTGDGLSVVTAGADGTLKVWSASSGASLRTITLAEGPATAMAVLGRRAATGHADGRVVLWDLDSGQQVATYRREEAAAVTAVGFARNGRQLIASGADATLTLWETDAPQSPVASVEAHDGAVSAVAHSDRGPFIATGGDDHAVRLWRAGDLRLVRTYRGHREAVSAIAFSPDGRHVAAAAVDGRIRVWSTSSASLYRINSQHKGRVSGIAFSPAGDVIASAGEDGTVQLWQMRQSRVMRAIAEGGTPARALALSPDGSRAAVATADGTVRFWHFRTAGEAGPLIGDAATVARVWPGLRQASSEIELEQFQIVDFLLTLGVMNA